MRLILLFNRSQKSPITAKRIQNIIEYMTYEIFRYTIRGFYEEHKYLNNFLQPLEVRLSIRAPRPTASYKISIPKSVT